MRSYSKVCFLILITVALVLIVFSCALIVFMKDINNERGWNNTSNAISFVSLMTSAITIIFVYKAYESQREEINSNNKNTEFNRALDILYKQLEFTNQRHFNRKDHSFGLIKLGMKLSDLQKYKEDIDVTPLIRTVKEANTFLDIICNDIHLFEDILFNNNLSPQEINTLFKIVDKNYFKYVGNLTSVAQKIDGYFNDDSSKDKIAKIIEDFQAGTETDIKTINTKYRKIFHMIDTIQMFLQENKTVDNIEVYRLKFGQLKK